MLILLTNDDGIRAPGLAAAYRELCKFGEVAVVAPESVQSGAGHGITLKNPLAISEVAVDGLFNGIAVDGRPADCVKLAINQLLPRTPDLVVSGINSGVNVGINVIYSGTVAAAIEGAFLGIPSIALSLLMRNDVAPNYTVAADFSRRMIERILKAGLDKGQAVSINLPALGPGERPAGIRVCRQCTRPWVDQYEKRLDPAGRTCYVNSSVFTLKSLDDDTDVAFLRDGHITVTPLMFDLTDRKHLPAWQKRNWDLR
ncbi:MAG: 5'/3'-nucleotidase SurE [Tepidisphaerales bacterium]